MFAEAWQPMYVEMGSWLFREPQHTTLASASGKRKVTAFYIRIVSISEPVPTGSESERVFFFIWNQNRKSKNRVSESLQLPYAKKILQKF